MKYINLSQVLQIHVVLIKQTGGSDGLRDLGRLESAIAVQTQSAFGAELYPTLFEKAAAMMRGIIADHPFIDGNKRTATLTALTLIEINDYRFVAPAGELEDFAVQTAVEHLKISEIAEWLKKHSTSL